MDIDIDITSSCVPTFLRSLIEVHLHLPQLTAVQALPKVCSPSSDHGVDCMRLAVDCCVRMAATQELWEALVPCLPPLLLCGGHHRASEARWTPRWTWLPSCGATWTTCHPYWLPWSRWVSEDSIGEGGAGRWRE
jgi:hypothetical protein